MASWRADRPPGLNHPRSSLRHPRPPSGRTGCDSWSQPIYRDVHCATELQTHASLVHRNVWPAVLRHQRHCECANLDRQRYHNTWLTGQSASAKGLLLQHYLPGGRFQRDFRSVGKLGIRHDQVCVCLPVSMITSATKGLKLMLQVNIPPVPY
jgi:hypothetical protein